MAIADTIKSMQTHTQNAYAKIGEKGGTIPANKNLENLSGAIESISAGGFAPEYVSFRNYKGSVLTLKGLDTSNVTNMGDMFSGCSNLTSLDVSKFNTSNVTDINSMFYNCSGLTSLNVSKFNTSKVTNMDGMFYNCGSLTSLDLSNFDTSNVTDMSGMFQGCITLQHLDISSFDFTNVTSYNDMFTGVPADCEILVKDETAKTWITSKFTNLTNVKIKV